MANVKTVHHENPDRLLRVAEAACLVGLSRATIYKLIAQKAFPVPLRVSAGSVRIPLSEVQSWIASHPRPTGDGERRAG